MTDSEPSGRCAHHPVPKVCALMGFFYRRWSILSAASMADSEPSGRCAHLPLLRSANIAGDEEVLFLFVELVDDLDRIRVMTKKDKEQPWVPA